MASQPTGNARDARIDVARGIAIVLVVFGHALIFANGPGISGAAESARAIIYAFHMPLLFVISGFVTAGRVREPYGDWVRGKAQHLLIPFFVWYSLPYLFGRKPHAAGILGWLTGLASYLADGVRRPENGLWYLYVLFVCLAVTAFVRAVTKRNDVVLLAVTVAALVAVVALSPNLGWGTARIALNAPWFVAGYAVGSLRPVWLFDLRFIGTSALMLTIAAPFPAETTGIAHALLPALYAIGGIGIALGCAHALVRTRVAALLAFLGRESLGIYVWHMFGLGVWSATFGLPLPRSIAGAVATTVVVVALSVAGTHALRLTPPTRLAFLGEAPRPKLAARF